MKNAIHTNKKQLHFMLELNDSLFVYAYIRKNACSAWKKLFIKESQYKMYAKNYKNPLEFMGKYHKVKTIDRIKKITNRIVVLRDPIDRAVSAFVNQYIMRMNRISDLHKKVQDFTGIDFWNLNFKEFIDGYLLKAPDEYIDAHFWNQTSHMAPVRYTHIWLLENLYKESFNFFGLKIANNYFLKKVNSTHNIPRFERTAYHLSAKKLFNKFLRKGVLPSKNALLSDELKEKLESYYQKDLKLYEMHKHKELPLNLV